MERMEIASLCFLHSIPGVGHRTLASIKQQVGSFQACLEGGASLWHQCSLPAAVCTGIAGARQDDNPASLYERLRGDGIDVCCLEDDKYPDMLRAIYDPPYLIYYKGSIDILDEFCLAVVGSRVATSYGKSQAFRFGRELAGQGIVVVSGMARGIDTEAHRGALEAGGKTAAVLGSGIDVIYPRENQKLYHRIAENGIVISEFAPGTRPEPGNFPARNRTISGLSNGVLVVEAKQRSGALITVDYALEQGREVFALPGPINSQNSAGTNNLIKQGACLVDCLEDILREYGMGEAVHPAAEQGRLPFAGDSDEAAVLEAMDHGTINFDQLIHLCGLGSGRLNTALLKLELEGIIRAMPGNYYVKV
ncbi:MAG: DNA-processing protein DprA [Syntrophomonadaceae bacterium]